MTQTQACTVRRSAQRDDSAAPVIADANGNQGVLARDLMTELMGVVPVLGNRKVAVGFAGSSAFCDATLSYVNIPALPETRVLPLSIARELRGFAAHEAAHLAFTDATLFPDAIRDAQGNFDALLKETWNCIEDYMIERHWLEIYPGAKKNFTATEARCCRGYLESHGKTPDIAKDLRQVGPVALTWMRSIYFGLGTPLSRDCLATLSPVLRTRVQNWFFDIEDVETTQDCLDAARRIHADILANPFDPADPPKHAPKSGQQGQTGQAGQQGQQGQSGQQGQAGQKGQQGQSGQQGQQSQSGQQDQQGQGGSGAGSDPANNKGAPAPLPTSSKINDALAEAGANSDEADSSTITSSTLSTPHQGPISDILSDPLGATTAQDILAEISGTTAATSAQLRRALKAIARDRLKGGRLDGKIDRKRLAGAALGAQDVHTRKVQGEAIDTAVQILVDCSGSMDGHELQVCQRMALALESAFSGTPISHEIVGYTNDGLDNADPTVQTAIAANAKQGQTLSANVVALYGFRDFTTPYTQALTAIGNMSAVRTGGTPTGDAILHAHERLARRPERRHVMFVLTDGQPNDKKLCKRAVKAVEATNTTVVGIGIGTDAVKAAFHNHVVINDVGDLPAVMLSRLSALLIGDKHKKATGRAARRT